ncbi:MAG: DUF2797 domain-containing protein [Betaproteobacteria bacterium]|nr:DUF2797 domain-containing protein [Betaproteobacteria bacterium]
MAYGPLNKLRAELCTPIGYALPVGDATIALNPLLGRRLSFEFLGEIRCIACGRKTSKSFQQGYCYPCMRSLAQCDLCIVKPELCHYAQGTCREPEWGRAHCMQTHYVYLANSSGAKVGITRASQIPTRWIDQGAKQALRIIEVATRHQAGLLEVAFARHVADKSNWTRLLKEEAPDVDLGAVREMLRAACAKDIAQVTERFGPEAIRVLPDEASMALTYPVRTYPQKVHALSLDKTPRIAGTLQGIKGQYLILDCGVFNIRKHAGYCAHVAAGDAT